MNEKRARIVRAVVVAATAFGTAAAGGWLAVDTRLGPKTLFSAGFGLDDPDDKTLPSGSRSLNQAVWATLIRDFRSDLRFGVEVSWWETEYLDLEDGASLRVQTSFVYSFSG